MLANLQMVLETEEKTAIPYQKAIILQSVLMSQINQEYAETMHMSGLHPYSQSLEIKEGKNIWNVCTTNEEAYHQIINPILSTEFKNFFMEHDEVKISIKEKKLIKHVENYYP